MTRLREVGVRALREELSRVLEAVQAGETVTVTNRGKPIARIEPVDAGAPAAVRRLVASGRASWNGQTLKDVEPVASTVGEGPMVADILLAQRGAVPG